MNGQNGRRRSCTIVRNKHFDVKESTEMLWRAISGIGTDDETIINVVASCNNAQRQEIKKQFEELYQKDLIKELKSELKIRFCVDFKQLLFALFKRPAVYDAGCLKGATKGLGTNERRLVEILLTRSPKELQAIREEYSRKFRTQLEDDVADDTSGDFRKFTFTLSRGKRAPSRVVDSEKAKDDASEINLSYTTLKGTDEPRFDLIGLCCTESYQQLKKTFEEYEKLTGKDITTLIENEFSGDVEEGLKWTVKCAHSVPEFFAERLHRSMEGLGTDNHTLIRIIVSRSEIDLAAIRDIYEEKYGKTLESRVKSDTSGAYKRLLKAIIRGNTNQDED